MWIIIKYKTKEINLVFNNLKKVIGEMPEFCIPKIKYTRYFGKKIKNVEAFLLEDYLICYHKKFSDNSTLFKLKYLTQSGSNILKRTFECTYILTNILSPPTSCTNIIVHKNTLAPLYMYRYSYAFSYMLSYMLSYVFSYRSCTRSAAHISICH